MRREAETGSRHGLRLDLRKNLRFLHHLRGWLRLLGVDAGRLAQLRRRLDAAGPAELAEIRSRCDYYLKLDAPFELTEAAVAVGDFRTDWQHRRRSAYFHDLFEHLRFHRDSARFHYRFGDNFSTPAAPTFVKARALSGDQGRAVLMKLNQVRHYVFANDPLPFEAKRDRLVWRGNAKREHRREFLRRFHQHPLCDVGQTNSCGDTAAFRKPFLPIGEQLRNKFILSIEGNDVATNLKWIFSSGSVCFMARPTRESWFMEGTLIPGHHYVLLRDDHADLDEQLRHHLERPDLCREIIRNANAHAARFRDRDMEALVALRVIDKYLTLSGQGSGLGFYEAGSAECESPRLPSPGSALPSLVRA